MIRVKNPTGTVKMTRSWRECRDCRAQLWQFFLPPLLKVSTGLPYISKLLCLSLVCVWGPTLCLLSILGILSSQKPSHYQSVGVVTRVSWRTTYLWMFLMIQSGLRLDTTFEVCTFCAALPRQVRVRCASPPRHPRVDARQSRVSAAMILNIRGHSRIIR